MAKRNENEPDNKALERLKEFNRQREAVTGDQQKKSLPPSIQVDKKKKNTPGAEQASGNNKKLKK